MGIFLLGVLVTMLPWFEEQAAQAGPSRVKVFLAASPDVRVQKDCYAILASSLTAQIAEAKTMVPARSAADADVVVQVKECRTADVPRIGGEVSVSARVGGHGHGITQTRMSVLGQLATVGRVILVVDDRGRPREFSPASCDAPLPEAARSATASLLAWIKATN
jgi:hypothetical protein